MHGIVGLYLINLSVSSEFFSEIYKFVPNVVFLLKDVLLRLLIPLGLSKDINCNYSVIRFESSVINVSLFYGKVCV